MASNRNTVTVTKLVSFSGYVRGLFTYYARRLTKRASLPNNGFTRPELLGVLAIVGAIILFSLYNFETSRIRARDEQRKNNATNLVHAVERYHADFGVFPPSTQDGRLVACGETNRLIPCEWGKSKLADLENPNIVYMDPIPIDPKQGQGISLKYISNGSEFQILTHLEHPNDPARSSIVEGWGLDCGESRCNYGVTGSLEPVTKHLE
ncbi:type II secretion system protein [Candidatus Microgenomates bacterium]|nr:type II secretion system protein [Candidatus Microgenomates bacterium]